MCRRKATTEKIPVAPGLLKEAKLHFQRQVKQMQEWHQIPDDRLSTTTKPLFRMYVARTTLSILKVVRMFLLLEKKSPNRSLVLFRVRSLEYSYQCN